MVIDDIHALVALKGVEGQEDSHPREQRVQVDFSESNTELL